MNREELLAKALDVLRYRHPFCGGPSDNYVDEDRQKAALSALEKGQVTEDAVAFVREQSDREWEIAKDFSQPDPAGFLSEKDRQRDLETAYRCEERYRELADQLEQLM